MPTAWKRTLHSTALVVAITLFGCGTEPNPPDHGATLLVSGNTSGDDDDPAVAVDANNTVHVVFLSDRDGTKDLYEVHSTAVDLTASRITWSTPLQITHNDAATLPAPMKGDNYPSLLIDPSGTYHLAWYRVDQVNAAHIMYARSDGSAAGWAAAITVSATTGPNFDRFPHLVRVATNDLRIYFNSSTRKTAGKNDVFEVHSADGGATWSAPAEVASLNTPGQQTAFPWVLKAPDGSFMATMMRWKLEPSGDFLDPTNNVFHATSSDGTSWSVDQVTSDPADNQNDLTPRLFIDHAGDARLVWATIAFGDPTADIVQMRVADRSRYPDLVGLPSPSLGQPDHSAEIVPITVGGLRVYLMIWVRIITPPHNQLVYQIFPNP